MLSLRDIPDSVLKDWFDTLYQALEKIHSTKDYLRKRIYFFVTMPLSGAERSKLWRERQKANPKKYEEYLTKEKERYKQKHKEALLFLLMNNQIEIKEEQEETGKQIKETTGREQKINSRLNNFLTTTLHQDHILNRYQIITAYVLIMQGVGVGKSSAFCRKSELLKSLKGSIRKN